MAAIASGNSRHDRRVWLAGGAAGEGRRGGAECQDLVSKDEVTDALGKAVQPDSLLNGDSTFHGCAYQAVGGNDAVVVSVDSQPASGYTKNTNVHGNPAKMNDKPMGADAVCAIRVQLNPKEKPYLNINTRIPKKENKNPCAVTKKLLGIAFDRIPNA